MNPEKALLPRDTVPWLLASALAATLPHFAHQPVWLSVLAGTLFLAAALCWYQQRPLPSRWLLIFLVISATAGILLEFRTLFGREAGISMLVVFMAMKLFELKSRRDASVLATLAFFLLLTHYLNSQSIATGLWLFVALLLITATLVRLSGGTSIALLPALRTAGVLLAQSLPFLIVLYLAFPRISGPLWGLPQDSRSAASGLSEQMSPGSIAALVQNGEIAFRARFDGPLPDKSRLYWRGPVLENYDGTTWRRRFQNESVRPEILLRGEPIAYTLTLEAHQQSWLLALDAPGLLPEDALLLRTMTALAGKPVKERRLLRLTAYPDYRFNPGESASIRTANLELPAGRNPRTLALAEAWRAQTPDPQQLVQRILQHFREQPFVYTLQPPLLGEQAMDDFLFASRRGFCEHYASAFVVFMRAAGVPARVIGGYQGGEVNPVDGHLIVRQSDAHAWAEVWLAGQGWVRVDPTAAVSPERVEVGIGSALGAGEPLPALVRSGASWLKNLRYRWEAVNHAWNQYILNYDPARQQALFARLAGNSDWRTLLAWLAAGFALAFGALLVWALWQQPRRDPAARLWDKARGKLARRGIALPASEAPLAAGTRIAREYPALAARMSDLVSAYCAARYSPPKAGAPGTDLLALRRAVARL